MKSPAFQFYRSSYLGSQRVQLMTLEEEGAYIRLLCSCWQHGSIPSDPELASRIIGKGGSTTLATTVLTMFQPSPNEAGRMIHERLELERKKQADWSKKSSSGGKKSAEIRALLKNGGSTTVPRVVEPPYQPNGNTMSLSLPLGISVEKTHKKFIKPSVQEIESEMTSRGIPKSEAVRFFNFYESNGWRVGRNPMKSWIHAIGNWSRGCSVNSIHNKNQPIKKTDEEILREAL